MPLIKVFAPSASCVASNKKLQSILEGKTSGGRVRAKYQNKKLIWQDCWNCQIRNLKQLWLNAKGSNGKVDKNVDKR